MLALAFNPLNDEMEPRLIETSFKVVEEFYISTAVGPLLIGEVWRDTETNRAIIGEMIAIKDARKKANNEAGIALHRLLNKKEK